MLREEGVKCKNKNREGDKLCTQKRICQAESAKEQIPLQHRSWNVGFPRGVRTGPCVDLSRAPTSCAGATNRKREGPPP